MATKRLRKHKVPLVLQTTNYCGPASLTSIMRFYGLRVTEKRVAEWSGASRKYGTWSEGLVLASRRAGFFATMEDGASLSKLKAELRNGPVIVLWDYDGGGHYSVVCGMDHNYIYMMEPVLGKYTAVTHKAFLKAWFCYEDEDDVPVPEQIVRRRMIVVRPWHPGRIR